MADIHNTDTATLPQAIGVQYTPIGDFPGYAVGDNGTVWSSLQPIGTWRRLPAGLGTTGYPSVMLWRGGRAHCRKVHRLVLEAFVGPRPDGMECRHFPDRDPANVRLDKLSWGTPVENAADRELHGTATRGVKHGGAKVTEQDVRDIRSRRRNGEKCIALAVEYGLSKAAISYICNGINWKHIT